MIIVRSPTGSVMTLTDPVVVGDTLIGFSSGSLNRVRVAVPLSQVALLQTKQFSVARTAGLVLLLTPVIYSVVFIIALQVRPP